MVLRTHSILHMRLSDLNYSNTRAFKQGEVAQGHGVHDVPDAAMLCLIYQKLLHKERMAKRVVGVWRQKPFLQCFTGMSAMVFLVDYRSDPAARTQDPAVQDTV